MPIDAPALAFTQAEVDAVYANPRSFSSTLSLNNLRLVRVAQNVPRRNLFVSMVWSN